MPEKLSFEETIQKIEAESVGLIRSAEKYLESARQRVRILEKGPDGSEEMKDTDDYSAEFRGA